MARCALCGVLLAWIGFAAGPAPGHVRAQPDENSAAAQAPSTRPLGLSAAAARKALASVPALAPFAEAFAPFADADADAALRRGGRHRDGIKPWSAMPSSFAWTPVPGKDVWVLTGRSGPRALLVLLYAETGGRFAHAASAVIEEPESSIVVGASGQYPRQLVWSSCYGCPGEGGTIRWNDDGRVEITYR